MRKMILSALVFLAFSAAAAVANAQCNPHLPECRAGVIGRQGWVIYQTTPPNAYGPEVLVVNRLPGSYSRRAVVTNGPIYTYGGYPGARCYPHPIHCPTGFPGGNREAAIYSEGAAQVAGGVARILTCVFLCK